MPTGHFKADLAASMNDVAVMEKTDVCCSEKGFRGFQLENLFLQWEKMQISVSS